MGHNKDTGNSSWKKESQQILGTTRATHNKSGNKKDDMFKFASVKNITIDWEEMMESYDNSEQNLSFTEIRASSFDNWKNHRLEKTECMEQTNDMSKGRTRVESPRNQDEVSDTTDSYVTSKNGQTIQYKSGADSIMNESIDWLDMDCSDLHSTADNRARRSAHD